MQFRSIFLSFGVLSYAFLISIIFLLLRASVFPSWTLTFFAPGLILSYYRKNFVVALWIAFTAGCFIDLLSAESHLGLHAFNYCLTTWILYSQKRNFFEDSTSTLAIMTGLFSLLSTSIHVVLLSLFEREIPLTWNWVVTDLIVLPMADACYAFLVFTLPLKQLTVKNNPLV